MNKKTKEILVAYGFLTPALIVFAVFFAIPIIAIITLSFTEYNMISPIRFVGLENFKRLFTEDKRYLKILFNTLRYVAIFLPGHLIIGFLLALGVNRKISPRWKYFYRTIIYFPVLVTTSAVSIVWIYIYDKEFGLLNYYLGKLGIEGISWLTSSKWAFLSIAIFGIWKFVGQPLIYYLVGLQNIPESLVEAALIDGANSFQSIIYITLPVISPTVFFVAITVMINTLQIFDAPYILTRGGPGDATRSLNLYIYEYAYEHYNMGYASTLALSLLVLILTMTLIMFLISRKYVHYEIE